MGVTFFADSFHEVNGVALTSRMLERFAQEHRQAFLSVHIGPETPCWLRHCAFDAMPNALWPPTRADRVVSRLQRDRRIRGKR